MASSSLQDDKKSSDGTIEGVYSHSDFAEGEVVSTNAQQLHRKLRGRQVQLFAVGGAIGTCKWIYRILVLARRLKLTGIIALFVQMGAALPKGGPAGLFIGFVAYGTIMVAVNQCFGNIILPTPESTLTH